MNETVNHPKHYNALPATCECGKPIECIQIVRHMGFNLGNVIKYLWRAGLKEGTSELEDLRKSAWYLDDEIKRRGGEPSHTVGANALQLAYWEGWADAKNAVARLEAELNEMKRKLAMQEGD